MGECLLGFANHHATEAVPGALEAMIKQHGGTFAYGDAPTVADCCLVPQVFAAERFGVDLTPFPWLAKVARHAQALPAFEAAAPARQPDADPE